MYSTWHKLLKEEWGKPYFLQLKKFVNEEYQTKTIYPAKENIFQALKLTDYDQVKVVILGQDPYHEPGQAQGLSFSVPKGVLLPPSLRNIYQELQADLNIPKSTSGDLTPWAKQGVLLLNTVLTVEKGKAYSHKGKGWEIFTDRMMTLLNERTDPIIFILWGKGAQEKEKMIDTKKHFILKSVHPSPLSAYRGFFGSKPFSKTNEILKSLGKTPINWKIPNN